MFQLNIDKCKEIRTSFSKINADLRPLFINGQELEVVQNAKLLASPPVIVALGNHNAVGFQEAMMTKTQKNKLAAKNAKVI
ncbi:hypothetical protein P5673_016078 [Acropora cervicornis]|uniref:Uncharacterized protein n=1 Tax=Acropora cervicornis TaxID=6130 RepID=A0AAD9V4H6_ACRCE|nr:hypothetical protein P5673_016078 [Acropora cervicornis]